MIFYKPQPQNTFLSERKINACCPFGFLSTQHLSDFISGKFSPLVKFNLNPFPVWRVQRRMILQEKRKVKTPIFTFYFFAECREWYYNWEKKMKKRKEKRKWYYTWEKKGQNTNFPTALQSNWHWNVICQPSQYSGKRQKYWCQKTKF